MKIYRDSTGEYNPYFVIDGIIYEFIRDGEFLKITHRSIEIELPCWNEAIDL